MSVRRSAEGFFGALREPAARRDTSDAATRSRGARFVPSGPGRGSTRSDGREGARPRRRAKPGGSSEPSGAVTRGRAPQTGARSWRSGGALSLFGGDGRHRSPALMNSLGRFASLRLALEPFGAKGWRLGRVERSEGPRRNRLQRIEVPRDGEVAKVDARGPGALARAHERSRRSSDHPG